jgi:diadenosine tetraphosphatase ApaH/serine/threonine PP2A family protein phosphatase
VEGFPSITSPEETTRLRDWSGMTLEPALVDDYVLEAMSGEIVVMSDRKWFGDPRGSPQYGSGMYAVFLDGRKAGVLPPRRRVVLTCDGGAHRVQVRQEPGRSPTLEVQVADHSGRFLSLWVVPSNEVSPEASK